MLSELLVGWEFSWTHHVFSLLLIPRTITGHTLNLAVDYYQLLLYTWRTNRLINPEKYSSLKLLFSRSFSLCLCLYMLPYFTCVMLIAQVWPGLSPHYLEILILLPRSDAQVYLGKHDNTWTVRALGSFYEKLPIFLRKVSALTADKIIRQRC